MKQDLSKIYMHTASGKRYFPFAPKAADVDLLVIAHHLATRCRWNGATQHPSIKSRIFYSVAEHSVYVSRYLEEVMGRPDLALAGLLHDGSESYNGDLIRPLKYSEEFREPFKRVELLNEAAVEKKFLIVEQMKDSAIKIADEAVCHSEWLQIIPKDPNEEWTLNSDGTHDDSNAAPYTIEMLPPHEAKEMFLARYYRCEVVAFRNRFASKAAE